MKGRIRSIIHPKISYLVLGLIGVGDTTYLFANTLAGRTDICLVSEGCNAVLSSPYASFLGLGLPMWGLAYYLLFFVGILVYYGTQNEKVIRTLAIFSVAGFLMSLYLVYLQLFVINSICEFCMLSAINSTLLFVIGMIWLYRNRKKDGKQEASLTSSQMTTEYSHEH